jgi:hypothetical protein
MYIARGGENTFDFFQIFFTFPKVLLACSKSLWKAERTLCKLGHFGLFFSVERLGLGKRDFKKKSTCVSFISGLILNFFLNIFLVSFEVKKRKSRIPLFSATIL